MFVVIPFAALGLLIILALQYELSWRSASILAAVVWGSLLVTITELLSLAQMLNLVGVLVAWLIVCGIAAFLLWRARKLRGPIRLDLSGPAATFRRPWALGIVCIIVIIGVNALIALPNSWDALAYHMPRVMHWIQNRSVADFAAHYMHQLYMGPASEFAIAHFQILSGGDYFANLVQWLSMIGSIVAASLIAQQLGGAPRVQLFAALFVATLPMGIAQASGSYNDYTASFWSACFAFYVVSISTGEAKLIHLLAAGASLGLAMLTKVPAYLYVFPFLMWLIVVLLRRFKLAAWKQLGLVAVLAFCLNAGHYARNLDVFGSPLGPTTSLSHANEVIGLRSLASNLFRIQDGPKQIRALIRA